MALRFRGLDAPIEVVYRKSSGSPPQPVDPYQQAAAQYGLSTGTAEFNAGLNRTNTVNPAGSSTWQITGRTGQPQGTTADWQSASNSPFGLGGAPNPPTSGTVAYPGGTITPGGNPQIGYNSPPPSARPVMSHAGTSTGNGYSPNPLSSDGLTGQNGVPPSQYMQDLYGTPGGVNIGGTPLGQGAPIYTQTTSLQPWANDAISKPIDTSGIAGMPGGPSTTQDLFDTQRSLYNQQMAYIKPQEDLANEQLDAQLANQGITPGSAAYNNAKDTQARANTFTNNQAINSAIQGGGAEQSRLFGLGSQSLQNQIAVRNAPINEFNALQGGAGANATAQTPDISGAFNQAYQGRLAGYNADIASQNADTSAAGSLIASYLMYLALA